MTRSGLFADRASAPASDTTVIPAAGVAAALAGLIRLGEAFAYSSALAALVGGAMTWAVGLALASPSIVRDAALVVCGAFVVYNVDRLRDLARDGASSPRRSAFVAHNRTRLVLATAIAAIALVALVGAEPIASIALVLAIGGIGLLHRRLKRNAGFKVAYVAAAWTTACVGLPWLAGVGAGGGGDASGAAGGASLGTPVLAAVFVCAAVTANLIASNLREGKRSATGWAPDTALALARGVAIASLAAVAIAPDSVAPLAWIPAAEAAALCFFRGSERFGHLMVDGGLLLGALAATFGSG